MTYYQPLLLSCLMVAIAGLWRARRRRVASLGICGLALVSWPPADWLLGLPLEAGYEVRPFEPPSTVQAIVVLGSAVSPPQFERPYALADRETFTRCEHAAWIYRRWGARPVLVCEGRQPVKGMMRELLLRAGVADEMIWVEDQSRSTHENAVYGAKILRRQGLERIALVVETQSMRRAAACFRKEGMAVTPAPSEFRTLGSWREELMPGWQAIRRNEITLHEMLGLAWYRARGWI